MEVWYKLQICFRKKINIVNKNWFNKTGKKNLSIYKILACF